MKPAVVISRNWLERPGSLSEKYTKADFHTSLGLPMSPPPDGQRQCYAGDYCLIDIVSQVPEGPPRL